MLEITRQPVVPQVPWRPIVLLVLLVGVLAASLVLAATRPKPPPPFGPAGNGLVVMSQDGDILTVDPRTGATVAIVTGPEIDSDPLWSQDGTTLLFRRASPDQLGADLLMVARANGSGVKQLTPEPLTGLTSMKVSIDLCAEAPLRAVARRAQRRPDLDRGRDPSPLRRRHGRGRRQAAGGRRHPVGLRVRSDRPGHPVCGRAGIRCLLFRPVPHRRRRDEPADPRRTDAGCPGPQPHRLVAGRQQDRLRPVRTRHRRVGPRWRRPLGRTCGSTC